MAQRPNGSRYRTPRYSTFLLTGAVLGVGVALGLATFAPGPDAQGGSGTFAYLALVGAIVGALVGGTVAVVVEKVVNRGRVDPLRQGRPDGRDRRR